MKRLEGVKGKLMTRKDFDAMRDDIYQNHSNVYVQIVEKYHKGIDK